MNLSIDLLSKSIEYLEAHPEALRIKKFIYCLCNSCWENDLNVFNQQSTEELLLELIKIQPTIKGLSLSMYGLVKSLNNQKLYASLAKIIVEQLTPIYELNQDNVENAQVQQLRDELAKQNSQSFTCINLMEILVKEAVFQELKKLPLHISKGLSPEEITTHALNHLPPLYVTSQEGKVYQLQKADAMKDQIYLAVSRAVGAILRDPLRKATPLTADSFDSISEVYSILRSLEKVANRRGKIHKKSRFNDLSRAVVSIVNEYDNSLLEIENFLKINNLFQERISPRNLAYTVQTIIRKLSRNNNVAPRKEPTTQIIDFPQYNETNDNYSVSIRDWYG